MAGIAETQELIARLRLDASQYEAALGQVGAKTAAFERQINSIGNSINRAVGQQTAALRAQAAEMEKIAAQSSLAGTGGRPPVSPAARQAAAASAAALRAEAQLIEDNAAAGTLAYERRAAAAIEAARIEAKAALDAANASKASLAERTRLQKAYDQTVIDGARARAAAEVRAQEAATANAARFTRTIGRIGSAARTAAVGGLKFLETTTLAAAAAGGILEFQFIKVQDAQAAFARTLTGDSAPAIAKATDAVLQLSKVVPLSVTELFKIAEVIGTTKVAAGSVAELTETVAKLAVTTDLSADEAAIGLSRLLNMFGHINEEGTIAAGAAEHLADAIFRSSLAFSSSDQEVLRAALRFGALSAAMGLTEGQVIALSGAVTGLGQEPEAVGGSFQRLFQIINKAVGEADKLGKVTPALAEFAKLANVTPEAFSQGIKEAPFETFIQMIEGFSKLSPTEQAVLFGKGGIFPSFVRGAQTLQNLGIAFGDVVDQAKEYDAATEASSKLNEAFAVRTDTLAKKLQFLGSALTRGAVAFGEGFDTQLGGAIQRVTDYLTENEEVFAEWGRKVGRAIESIDWNEVKRFASAFFEVFRVGLESTKALLDFLGPQLVAILGGLKLVNSLSGGAVGKLGGGLISGLGGILAKALGNVFAGIPLFGKLFVQPVFVTNQGFGGVGGGMTIAGASIAAISAGIGFVILSQLPKILEGPPDLKTEAGVKKAFGIGDWNFIHGFIEWLRENGPKVPSGGGGRFTGFGHGSDVGALTNVADAWKSALIDEQQAALELSRAAGQTSDAANSLLKSAGALLAALKPAHRRGEVGKSIETTEGRKLRNLDLDDANFATKLTTFVGALVKHYTKEPIGSPGHGRGFVLGNVNPIERNLAGLLRQAIRDGNEPAQDLLVQQLQALDSIPKNDLSPKIERLIETVRQKKLRVNVHTSPTKVFVKQGNLYTTVHATIGKRTISRSVYGGGGYGPAYVFGGNARLYESEG